MAACLLFILSCSGVEQYRMLDAVPRIFPDCAGVIIPYNIAPLNFRIMEEGDRFMARFSAGCDSFDVYGNRDIRIPAGEWKELLRKHVGTSLSVSIFAKEANGWVRYRSLQTGIASEPIDPWLAYRLIEPGYNYWGTMGIYQRNLETFDEMPVILNTQTDGSCMNCHSFCNHSPEQMLFHVRAQYAGTVISQNGTLSKLNLKTPGMISAGVYPRWHPQGKYIAFSINKTYQAFHSSDSNLVEVYDESSDLIIYNTETRTAGYTSVIHSPDRFETFPEWSSDGKTLYFCSAPAKKMPASYDSLRYDLLKTGFNAQTAKTGSVIDTVLSASATGKSVSLPRISPDGKYLVVCLSSYGTFPIWHKDNDLYLLNLTAGVFEPIDSINSPESDSYHSWSSNGRWMVYSSRRMDGLYTRPYIAYFDTSGIFHKPFLLPQKEPSNHYSESLKSYNVPEFIAGKINVSPQTFEHIIKKEAVNVKPWRDFNVSDQFGR
jgi:dipeptidyl aminopeptidase/acylaminoacyl peptidase